jgi:hypothetical protein
MVAVPDNMIRQVQGINENEKHATLALDDQGLKGGDIQQVISHLPEKTI